MDKKITPLEAFHKIIEMAHEPNGYQNFTNACDTPYTTIVETALEDYEDMKFDYQFERLKNQALRETNLRNILRVKIIDTIREKGIDILALKQCKKCKTPKRYNEMTSYAFHKSLTQEEFDLYKETFL